MPEYTVQVAPRVVRDAHGVGDIKASDRRREDLRSSFSLPKRETDPRYRTSRWQRIRLRVLNRDRRVCQIVPGCSEVATTADHIIPVFPGMPDALFFALDNLRAACREHNLARGHVAKLQPRAGHHSGSDVVTSDYSQSDDGAS